MECNLHYLAEHFLSSAQKRFAQGPKAFTKISIFQEKKSSKMILWTGRIFIFHIPECFFGQCPKVAMNFKFSTKCICSLIKILWTSKMHFSLPSRKLFAIGLKNSRSKYENNFKPLIT